MWEWTHYTVATHGGHSPKPMPLLHDEVTNGLGEEPDDPEEEFEVFEKGEEE